MPSCTPAPLHPSGRRRFGTALVGLLGLVAALLTPAALAVSATAVPVEAAGSYERDLFLDHGHVDAFNIDVVDGVPTLNLKEDVTGSHVRHQPEDVELHVKQDALMQFPASGGFPEGLYDRTAYYLPMTQNPDLLWPGWDSQSLGSSGYSAPVNIHITGVEGPGEVYLWSTGTWGSMQSLLADGGYQLPGTITQSFLAHVHANWAFTEPGDYWLTASADVLDTETGAVVATNSAQYLFSVGDFDRAPEVVAVSPPEASYPAGSEVTLTASQSPEIPDASWSWQSRVPGGEWSIVEGQNAPEYRGTAHTDGEQVRAIVTVGDTSVTSEPVTVVVEEEEPDLPTSLTLDGLANPYDAGSDIVLEAKPDLLVDDATFAWQISTDGEAWTLVEGQDGPVYTGTAELDGQHIRAQLLIEGEVIVTSEPVTVEVTESEDPPLPTALAIEGLTNPYDEGAPVELTAAPDVEHAEATYRWEESAGTDEWSAISGQNSATYTGTAETDGQLLRAVLVIDGEVVVASDAVTIEVSDDDDNPGGDDPGQCWDLMLETGHVDAFNIGIDDGAATLTLKEDVTGSQVVHDPRDVELHVKERALTDLPGSDALPGDLRGVAAYYLPLNQDQELLWPGWDSQELSGSGYDTVDIDITDVDGPGEVYLWTNGSFGELRSVLTDERYQLPGTIHQDYLAHVHANWAFTEPGAYYLTVSATATNSGTGAETTTDTARYLFSVGDELPDDYRDCLQPPATSPQAPDAGELTEATSGDVSVDPNEVRAGEQVTILAPAVADAYGAAFLYSDPAAVTNDWVLTDGEGAFQAAIPAGTAPGEHRVAVVDRENTLVGWTALTVLPAAVDETPDPDEETPDPTPRPTPDEEVPDPDGSDAGPTPVQPQKDNGSGTPPQCFPVESNGSGSGSDSGSGSGGSSGATGSVVYGTEGHFDFGAVVDDGTFEMQVKDDRTAPPVWRDPSTVVFVLDDSHARRDADIVPDDLSFIAPQGQDVWMIQQNQEAGVPWLGWNTQHETIVNGPGANGVEMTLESVEGPGELAIFLNGNFGQLVGERVVDTVGGPLSYTIPANTHQHGNWVFTEPGAYAVTFTLSADGESATDTLRFSVGQDDPSSAAQVSAGAGVITFASGDDTSEEESAAPDGSEDSADGAAAEEESGDDATTGRTASGQPCSLASTGTQTDLGSLAMASALAAIIGVLAVVGSRRLRVRR
ncbi:TIGR03773 family transporter-associated surface protein [Ruania halotolerans]|uniref:TIGR03773 family transporter-associated surface protein n=1 Tax=Ruania halotolerans TaxID=2897773 RepID=UPI001E4AD5F5|nr:TIGR03773 family transporter-associated surface protein [Ruania halotolerans]UFU05374.1 TIGR03773 family transporter-associated surface protein [Ruania halotolerans]